MRSIGVGVIGAGVMGAEHARLIACEVSGAHLAAVADADLARAAAAAHGGRTMADPVVAISQSEGMAAHEFTAQLRLDRLAARVGP